jgi:hypothetical protein
MKDPQGEEGNDWQASKKNQQSSKRLSHCHQYKQTPEFNHRHSSSM